MGTITVNGKSYVGNNISIRNGVVVIDGKLQDGTVSGVVEVMVSGELVSLETDASVTCEEVKGNVSAGGSVSCGAVGGTVNAGGSVTAGRVGGGITAGGSVRAG